MILTACIALAAGATVVVLPTSALTLRWTHSVERTGWEEDYVATPAGLTVTEARIEALGAGMEPPATAVRDGRWWHYRPSLPPLDAIAFANTMFADGYSICWEAQCRRVSSIVPRGTPFKLTTSACERASAGSTPAAVR